MRKTTKILLFVVALILVSPLLLVAWLEKALSRSEMLFSMFAQALSILPGPVGHSFRAAYYFGTLERCAWEIHIGFGSIFTHRDARIAKYVSTGAYCVIGHVDIGEGVRIASRVSIPSGKRQHLDDTGELSDETHYDRLAVEKDAWLGEAVTIIANVGARSIVSAGAVVVNDVPPDTIVGGNPAKVLKSLRPQAESE